MRRIIWLLSLALVVVAVASPKTAFGYDPDSDEPPDLGGGCGSACVDNDQNDNDHPDCMCGGRSLRGGCRKCDPCSRDNAPDYCNDGGTTGGGGSGGTSCSCGTRTVPVYGQRCEWDEDRNGDPVRRCRMVITGYTTIPGDNNCPGCACTNPAYYSPTEDSVCKGVTFQKQGYKADGTTCGNPVDAVGTKTCNCTRCAGSQGCTIIRWADAYKSTPEECAVGAAYPVVPNPDTGSTQPYIWEATTHDACACGAQYKPVGDTGPEVSNGWCAYCPITGTVSFLDVDSPTTVHINPESFGIAGVVGNHICQSGFEYAASGEKVVLIRVVADAHIGSVDRVSIAIGNNQAWTNDVFDVRYDDDFKIESYGLGAGSNGWYHWQQPTYRTGEGYVSVFFRMGFNENFPIDRQQVRYRIEGVGGNDTGWVDVRGGAGNLRQFRYWDCQVPMTGNIYDSSISNGAVCSSNIGFNNLAQEDMGFRSLQFVPNNGGTTVGTNVTTNSYSTNGSLLWGKTYNYQFNSDLNGGGMTMRMSTVNPTASSCGTINLSGISPVNPYYTNPQFRVDFLPPSDLRPYPVRGFRLYNYCRILNYSSPPHLQSPTRYYCS